MEKKVREQISLDEYMKGKVPTIHDINRWGKCQISLEEYLKTVKPSDEFQISLDEYFEGCIPMIHDVNTWNEDRQVSIEEACGPLQYVDVNMVVVSPTKNNVVRSRKHNKTIRPITKNR